MPTKFELQNMKAQVRPSKIRIAVTQIQEKFEGIIVIPNAAVQDHRIGQVVAVGAEVEEFKTGDHVIFQVNKMFEAAITHMINETPILFMHQGDAIGKLSKNVVTLDSFTTAGDFLLLEEVSISQLGGIYLPQTAIPPPEFRVVQIGSNIPKDEDPIVAELKVGDEVFVDRAKATRIRIDQKAYYYTQKTWVHGSRTKVA